ncbi:MAG: hypothetical protein FJ271_19535 [Planctomycetes bacterium]|nr:hypothetical protein [Planctomycetota bacterium]
MKLSAFPVALACVTLAFAGVLDAGDKKADEGVREVIASGIKAMGGDKLARVRGLSWKGKMTVDIGGAEIGLSLDATSLDADRHRIEAELTVNGSTNPVMLVIKGGKAWVKGGDNVNDLPEKEAAKAHDIFFAARLPHLLAGLKDKTYTLSHLGEVKVGDSPAVGVRIARQGKGDMTLFFDKKSKLPVKAGFRFNDGQKEYDMAVTYDDYRDVEGCQLFSTIIFRGDNREFRMELSNQRPRDDLDDDTFARPQ